MLALIPIACFRVRARNVQKCPWKTQRARSTLGTPPGGDWSHPAANGREASTIETGLMGLFRGGLFDHRDPAKEHQRHRVARNSKSPWENPEGFVIAATSPILVSFGSFPRAPMIASHGPRMEMPAGPGGFTVTPEPGGVLTLTTPPSGPPTVVAQPARSTTAAKRPPQKNRRRNFIWPRDSKEIAWSADLGCHWLARYGG